MECDCDHWTASFSLSAYTSEKSHVVLAAICQIIFSHHIQVKVFGSLYLPAVMMASWFGGGMVKHTEGTIASFPVGLMTFHLVL